MSATPLGRPCWYELMTTDPDGAPSFYTSLAGWTTDTWEGGENPYTMWLAGGSPIGGLMKLPEEVAQTGAPSHWLMYVSTPDVEATADKVKELGGSILTKLDIPSVGQIVVVQDPQGAVFCAYQPADESPGHDDPPRVGEFSWLELATTDWQAAWSFYSKLFGWQQTDQMDMGDMGMYQMFGRGAHPLGGIYNRPPEMPVSAWLLYIRVPDVAAAVETVKTLGGQVLNGPMEVPGGDMVAQCLDPAGAAFAVHSSAQGPS